MQRNNNCKSKDPQGKALTPATCLYKTRLSSVGRRKQNPSSRRATNRELAHREFFEPVERSFRGGASPGAFQRGANEEEAIALPLSRTGCVVGPLHGDGSTGYRTPSHTLAETSSVIGRLLVFCNAMTICAIVSICKMDRFIEYTPCDRAQGLGLFCIPCSSNGLVGIELSELIETENLTDRQARSSLPIDGGITAHRNHHQWGIPIAGPQDFL